MAGGICQVSARAILLVSRGAAKAAVAAGVRSAAVARDLATVHAQLSQASLHLLVWLAVLLNACRRRPPSLAYSAYAWACCFTECHLLCNLLYLSAADV